MMPAIRRSSSSTSEGETFSRVVATSCKPPSCVPEIRVGEVSAFPSGRSEGFRGLNNPL